MLTALVGSLVLGQMFPAGTMGRPEPQRQNGTQVQVDDAAVLGAIGARDANLLEACTLAEKQAGGADVRQFVAELRRSHGESLTRGGELAKQLNLHRELPADSVMARMQREKMDELALLSGAAFDRVFVRYVLDAHTAELEKMTSTNLPGARHPLVQAFVRDRLPSLNAHKATASEWLAAHPG
jgi:predicted outer membrane protein